MPTFFVCDHNNRTLAIYHDLQTNKGATQRAKRYHPTAVKIERWNGEGRPYYNPEAKPNLIINL